MYWNILKYQPLIHLTKRFLDFLKKKNYNWESRAQTEFLGSSQINSATDRADSRPKPENSFFQKKTIVFLKKTKFFWQKLIFSEKYDFLFRDKYLAKTTCGLRPHCLRVSTLADTLTLVHFKRLKGTCIFGNLIGSNFFCQSQKKNCLGSPAISRRRRPQNDVRPSAAPSACVHFGRHTYLRAL